METLLDVILSQAEITKENARLTVKEAVLQEDDTAKCVKTASGFSIRSGRESLGRGKTVEQAWESAVRKIFGW